ncbi:hypothetical protein TL16_g12669 [Triparma laevis f. inornata]|uniref:PPM-type phosphatase domain-containing protein n=2 Tax=Triparma laevis TaxID=1534972 RepID=A0A9W7FTS6_9STRA|nr:hypothetical protein TL16_g12669 [Triparma laevis f. inornata]GMI18000.1 hypothetical protein TrLO_g9061 [Triparma laevis f. longispina]
MYDQRESDMVSPPMSPKESRGFPMSRTVMTKTVSLPPVLRFKSFHVNSAISTASLKGEDRSCFDAGSTPLTTALPTAGLFAGVFDGHDGPDCSEYCRVAMIPHFISSLTANKTNATAADKALESPQKLISTSLISSFQDCESNFGKRLPPPPLDPSAPPPPRSKLSALKDMMLCRCGTNTRRGGTTANCLLLNVDSEENISAFVANCGDSRCITDAGTGSSSDLANLKFSNISEDHRPTTKKERTRLRSAEMKGEVHVVRDSMKTTRLYPGGLAVSRTIGDVSLTRAAIPTPEIAECEVKLTEDMRNVRFLLGTDGIFDTMETREITEAVKAEEEERGGRLSAKDLAKVVLVKCLEKSGISDDMSVLVIDIVKGNEEIASLESVSVTTTNP